MAETFDADLALLDIGLPVMDGYELARRLRKLPRYSKTRLVALNGYGQDTDRRRSAEDSFDGHLVKPVQLEAIVEILRVGDGATADLAGFVREQGVCQ